MARASVTNPGRGHGQGSGRPGHRHRQAGGRVRRDLANGHGNVSLRVPGEDEMYFTAGPRCATTRPRPSRVSGLDGTLARGRSAADPGRRRRDAHRHVRRSAPRSAASSTRTRPTRPPCRGHRPIGCWIEALAMFGLPDGVPVAGYGPRGSDQAVANIRAAVTPGRPRGAAREPRRAGVPPDPRPGHPGRRCRRGGRPGRAERCGDRRRRSRSRRTCGRRPAAGHGLRRPRHRRA